MGSVKIKVFFLLLLLLLLLSLFQKKDAVVKDENDAGLKKALDHKNRLLGYDKNLYV